MIHSSEIYVIGTSSNPYQNKYLSIIYSTDIKSLTTHHPSLFTKIQTVSISHKLANNLKCDRKSNYRYSLKQKATHRESLFL